MNTRPAISIVTPCYNSAPFLSRIYGSLRAQKYRNFEWVCVDDLSSDDTVEQLRRLRPPGDLGMQVYQLPINTYGPVAIAVGTERARGDAIIWLDHDDELTPDALDLVARNWTRVQTGDTGLIFSIIDPATSKPIGGRLPVDERLSMRELMVRAPAAADVALALKADVARKHASIEKMEDVALNGVPLQDMERSGRFLVCAGALKIYHRDHEASQTNLERISRKTVASYARLLDGGYPASPTAWMRWAATMMRMSRQVHGSWFAGLRHMTRIRAKLGAIAALPLAYLSFRKHPVSNVVEYAPFTRQHAEHLTNLWRRTS
jgi:glycosyltransferase involved in cell wall biosynthesis